MSARSRRWQVNSRAGTTYAKAPSSGLAHPPLSKSRHPRARMSPRSLALLRVTHAEKPRIKRTQPPHGLWLPQWGCGERPPLTRTYLPKKNGRAQSEGNEANSVLAWSSATTTAVLLAARVIAINCTETTPVLLAGRASVYPRKVALAITENAVDNPMHKAKTNTHTHLLPGGHFNDELDTVNEDAACPAWDLISCNHI